MYLSRWRNLRGALAFCMTGNELIRRFAELGQTATVTVHRAKDRWRITVCSSQFAYLAVNESPDPIRAMRRAIADDAEFRARPLFA